jgi:hypothetical protein
MMLLPTAELSDDSGNRVSDLQRSRQSGSRDLFKDERRIGSVAGGAQM